MAEQKKFEFPLDGRLSRPMKETAQRYLESKTKLSSKCPTCRADSWFIMDHFISLRVFYGKSDAHTRGGLTYPNVGLLCTNCGNTQLINALHVFEPTNAEGATNNVDAGDDESRS
ncbi:hypothetical protein [Brucella intermedia]|uniref:hypothetical protein n=1 Tax=Brucella intermedia TaxID=94625 RepID=UPI00124CA810|nr:hypothetical protein [Brucella intermedia]KAB2730749.1 hypothetical protein F9L02_11925 [Brucella intermedia]